MIVVLSILSITMGMFITGIGMLTGLPARQCARELKSAIEKTRIDTMGTKVDDAILEISVENDGVYVEEKYSDLSGVKSAGKKRVCSKRVSVDWGGSELTETKKLYFKRETGGFAEGCNYVSEIKVGSGSHQWKLKLGKLTGIVELEKSSGSDE